MRYVYQRRLPETSAVTPFLKIRYIRHLENTAHIKKFAHGWHIIMGHMIHITGALWGESIGDRWILKGQVVRKVCPSQIANPQIDFD